jgi:tetratricopeptide (TPR) repeat protein
MADVTKKLTAALPLHQHGRLDEAEAIYHEILSEQPDHADALHLNGLIAHQRGRHDEALAGVERAIASDNGNAMYHANRARILRALDRHGQAADAARSALALEPDNAETLCELAGALLDIGNADEALSFAMQAVALAPELKVAYHTQAMAYFDLGCRSQEVDQLDEAEKHYRLALQADPESVEARVNLGNVYRLLYRLDDAADCYKKAISLVGELPTVCGNLGVVLQELGDTRAAITWYDKALSTDSDNPEIRRNRAQALLKLGQFKEGWQEFEWRWKTAHFAGVARDWVQPRWQGEPLNGDVVLVHAEQGFGDSLQFARYLPMIAERGATVVVECPETVITLIAGVEGVEKTVAFGTPLPPHDYQIPMMSLPGVFETNFETMPNKVPYISIPEDRVTTRPASSALHIGLVWKGSANHQRNAWRSPGLEVFQPLTKISDIKLFSLQKDDEVIDLQDAGLESQIVALGNTFEDFSDTAAAILNLDLVITPDTAVAHLAGALAKPVWLILPFSSEWRWFEEREDSPWYPTMRLFHQPVRDDWAGAVSAMVSALEKRQF